MANGQNRKHNNQIPLTKEYKQLIKNIKESERVYNYIAKHSQLLICTHDLDGVILSINKWAQKIFGHKKKDILNKNIQDFLTPQFKESFRLYIEEIRQKGISKGMMRIISKSGGIRILSYHNLLIQKDSSPPYIQGLAHDITKEIETKSALKENEREYRELFNNLLDVFLQINKHGEITKVSPSVKKIWGYKPSEIMGVDLIEKIFVKETGKEFLELVLQNKTIENYEIQLNCKDGKVIWISINAHIKYLSNGEIFGIEGIARDITNQKEMQLALSESENRYHSLFRTAPVGLGIADLKGNLIEFNDAMLHPGGYTKEDILKIKNVSKLYYDPIDRKKMLLIIQKNGFLHRQKVRFKKKNGSFYYALLSLKSIMLNGQHYMQAMVEDITEREIAEQEILYRIELEKLITSISKNFINVSEIDIDDEISSTLKEIGVFAEVDRVYVFQFSLDGKTMSNTFEWCSEGIEPQIQNLQKLPTNIFPWWMEKLNRLETIYIPHVSEMPDAANAEKEVLQDQAVQSLLVVPMARENLKVGFLGFDAVRTIKKWKEADIALLNILGEILVTALERKRLESEMRKLNRAVLQSPVSIIITNKKGDIEYVNDQFTNTTGYNFNEVIGKNPRILQSGNNSKKEFQNLWLTISSGKQWHGIFQNQKKNKEIYWEQATISPIKNPKGEITHYIGFQEDITERRELEEQLRQSQKMETIGQLAGGIAHDFNNLLTVIMGYSDFILANLDQADPLKEEILEIARAGKRATDLTRHLLAFSRKQVLDIQTININFILSNLEKMLRRIIGENIHLTFIMTDNLYNVEADTGQMEQVLVNLVINARDAMPLGGKLTIETKNINLDESYTKLHLNVKPGKYVKIKISDNGIGMSNNIKERIFEPFFTTKEKGKGTGLGLAMVYGIITQLHGHIDIHSTVNKGTTFEFYIPKTDAEVAQETERKKDENVLHGTETILVIEDEDSLRNLAKRILEKSGYKVITASDGEQGFHIFKKNKEHIDLIITDILMPELNGIDMIDKIKKSYPNLPVIFMSGYTENALLQYNLKELQSKFIPKPFTPQMLAKKVSEILEISNKKND